MSEIEKMYKTIFGELAPNCGLCAKLIDCKIINNTHNCNKFKGDYKSLFTAEKQLAIIKLISKQGQVIIENWEKDNRGFNIVFRANSHLRFIIMDCITRKTTEEALAQIVNDIWQDLTEEEKQEIKRVLEDDK